MWTSIFDLFPDPGLIPGLGRSQGEGNGNPLQYSCLENPMDRGAWQARVHRASRVRNELATKPPPLLSLYTLGVWSGKGQVPYSVQSNKGIHLRMICSLQADLSLHIYMTINYYNVLVRPYI